MSKVKLQFEADLGYQHRAIEAVCSLFEGQGNAVSPFTVLLPGKEGDMEGLRLTDMGTGNKPGLTDAEIHRNLLRTQESNGQVLSAGKAYEVEELSGKKRKISKREAWDFTVEMETGTGKTYVYLRTIFELHKRYGFSKFIIVVPSIAIKEGVFKSIELMREHFRHLYDGTPMHATLYDSAKIGEVCNYARSNKLEIMVCTVQAITDIQKEKDEEFNDAPRRNGARRVMYTANEKTGGMKPIEYIRQCHPIVIVDEPQNVGEKGELNGITQLNPLCTLRYSATHRNLCHPIYTLNAVDASAQKLVKHIEVAGLTTNSTMSGLPYIAVKQVGEKKGQPFAKLSLLADLQGKQKDYTVYVGDDLEIITNNELYTGIRVQMIAKDGVRFVPESMGFVGLGQCNASTDDKELVRQMIRETIKRHLKRMAELRPQGIKVLSLFFLDAVANYRWYDEQGRHPGEYAKIFEEEYSNLANLSQYRCLWADGVPPAAETVHDGYFSIDKGGKNKEPQWIDTKENNQAGKDAAKRAYELIMRDKERLLSLDEPLQFIFSHTALREGWDNPNVFQVCVLRDANSPISRRQIIGRGLRICVDNHGRRVREEGVNTLTVVAKEHFSEFAAHLQQEYEAEGMRFGIVTQQQLGAITLPSPEGQEQLLGQELGKQVLAACVQLNIVAADGKLTDEANKQLQNSEFELPPACVACVEEAQRPALQEALLQVLRDATRKVNITDANEVRELKVREKWKDNRLFLELWERIKHRSIFEVKFSTEQLIRRVSNNVLHDLMNIPAVKISISEAGVVYRHGGISTTDVKSARTVNVDTSANPVPDIVSELVDKTNLTRRTVVRILRELPQAALKKAQDNCAEFLRRMIAGIKRELQELMVDGICYRPVIIGKQYYDKQLFLTPQQVGDIKNILEVSEKCLTEHIVCDSGSAPERRFAHDADLDESVKFYVKLPDKFTIPTPLGLYNPDWAMVKQEDGEDILYFVVETKGSSLSSDLRTKESLKIKCARKHFEALNEQQNAGSPVRFCGPVSKLSELY